MPGLRLLADDLTGAADSAAPFASRFASIRVSWAEGELDSQWEGSLALSMSTREVGEAEAGEACARLAQVYAGADLPYCKIDSRLRGWPAVQIAELFRSGGFDKVVVAPAFPAQGVITVGGEQLGTDRTWIGGRFEPLARQLRKLGHSVDVVSDAVITESSAAEVLLCDAASQSDLDDVVQLRTRLQGRILWAGSGGLARALAGDHCLQERTVTKPVLMFVGSNDPVSRSQLAEVERIAGLSVTRLRPGGPLNSEWIDSARSALERAGVAVIALPDFQLTSDEAEACLDRSVESLMEGISAPSTLVLTGGETALRVLQRLNARHLEIVGEVSAGVPVSRIVGGSWDGAEVVTKSGGFGNDRLLVQLLESFRPSSEVEGCA
jgi:uncharacterized protein YgbK (DUF1537 family)